jgi:GT2 family glycosyltransferase/glycosyltransferase involved in cell wall biosynthesis
MTEAAVTGERGGRPRALVSQTRVPEIDRDSGSQQVDLYVRWLLDAGWSVTFVACEHDGEESHARRLRQLGVPTFVGYEGAEELLAVGEFDLAVLAFWEPASRLLPVIRRASPDTRVIVDSVDLHFLREARRMLGAGVRLDEGFGPRAVGELNTYRGADAVLTVSAREAELLGAFIGSERTYELPHAKTRARSSIPFEERSGMFFVGNFRHLPNGEAVEYLCREILPRLDSELLSANPLTVAGSRLDEKVRVHGRGLPGVRMIGWVPAIEPYLERARVCMVPLLHGAGVKGKIVEAMMVGTPVVTTPIGAEGLDLRDGEHALIGETPDELARGLSQLLTDAEQWQRVADAGHELVSASHAPARVGERFLEIADEVLRRPVQAQLGGGEVARAGRRELAYRDTVAAVDQTVRDVTDPGSAVVVVSRGDDRLAAVDGRDVWHFPRAPDGRWAGHHPADAQMAIRHLQELHDRGARYFVLPSSSFWWLNHYRDLFSHLDGRYRRIHSSEHAVVFDLDAARESDPSEWVLHMGEGAVLPDGFEERFLRAASALSRLGMERVQPAHGEGPEAGPPVTEQLRGVVARELEAVTPMPVLAVRRGAAAEGPTAIVDSVPIALEALPADSPDPLAYSNVRDVFVGDPEAPRRAVQRSQWSPLPHLSVLIATYDRPDALAECLEGFCEQTLPVAEFEVVVVDDGTPGPRTEAVLREFSARLPLTWVRIEHAGRGAAKNLAVLLARGELVLFFDDDDVPAPDLLAEHVRAHEAHPDEPTAVLGHTEWAPGLAVSPLMHYLTDVDAMLFAYGHLEEGKRLDWRCFWEGRVSSKRSLHLRHGLHDQRLAYSIDVEMAWRLAPHGLEVVYHPGACSFMARPVDFEEFCARREAKGRAQAAIAEMHDDPNLHKYLQVEGAAGRWERARPELAELREGIRELERELNAQSDAERDPSRFDELHRSYRAAFEAYTAKGIAEGSGGPAAALVTIGDGLPQAVESIHDEGDPVSDNGGEPPALTVTMPVWSRTPEAAQMAVRTIERVWEVARLPTEVAVVDNGSPEPHPGLRARVLRVERNEGVASGWNKGIELARAPVIAVLNSDCWVEPGWDEALYEAVTTGRRIAFPYTDHCDGRGFRQPDQAGTAGWCFMLTREIVEEVGRFDERFNPAYVEDTDYWHRAWELGIELSPVPAARVTHARRTSADPRADWLLTAHRYIYGWKHGVEPMRPPPYYNREIVEYDPQGSRSASTT